MIIRKEISLKNPWLLAWNSQPGSKKKSKEKKSNKTQQSLHVDEKPQMVQSIVMGDPNETHT